MKRIIDKQTKIFIRDDFDFNPEIEIPIDEPIEGLYAVPNLCPLWDVEKWMQNIEPPITEPTVQEPSLEERVTATETNVVTMQETIDAIFGGV